MQTLYSVAIKDPCLLIITDL